MDQDRTQGDEREPGDYGNTVDGSRPGDGGGPGTADRGATVGGDGDGHSAADHHERERREPKEVYQTPDAQSDHAVGGTEGTTDGR